MSVDVDVTKKNVDIDKVEASLGYAHRQIESLARSVQSLPEVDEDGYSECPFAEDMYAQKEEIQATLSSQLKDLYREQEAIEAEITRCKNNLVVISTHESRIHRDSVRDRYSQAEVELSALIQRLCEMKEELAKTIKVVQAALARAAEKYFPGRRPRKGGLSGALPAAGAHGDSEMDDLWRMDQQC